MTNSHYEITQVCDDIKNMLLEKNMKYGDSALNPVRVMSKSDTVEQLKVRIDDKLSRLSQGHLTDNEDVINDLIGYFVLLKIAKQRENTTNEQLSDGYEHSKYWYDYDRNRPAEPVSTFESQGEDTINFSGIDNTPSSLYNDSYSPFQYSF